VIWTPKPAAVLAATILMIASACASAPGDRPSNEESMMATPVMFTLTSTAFADGGAIPRKYTCDAADVSPPLAWAGAPAGTAAYALLVTDRDARGFVHWVAADIPGSATGLAEGATGTAAAGLEGRTDFGRTGWGGPCPPSGTHRYVFELYALTAPLGLGARPSAADVNRALAGRTLGKATLTGTYQRAK
jgi:Raf kinase inhibitor-like YbhB/YbcL family protein